MLLKVESGVDSTYKVTWCLEGAPFICYSIGAEALKAQARLVRCQLDRLSKYMKCVQAQENSQVSRGEVLRDLAQAGKKLRLRFFDDPQKKAEIKALQAWIALESDKNRDLVIYASMEIDVPWGLMFDGDLPPLEVGKVAKEEEEAEDEDEVAEDEDEATQDEDEAAKQERKRQRKIARKEIREFSGFWCLKYRPYTTSISFVRSPQKWKRPRASFGLLSLINSDVKARLAEDLPPRMCAKFREMLELPVGEFEDLDKSVQVLSKTPNADLIVHFLGHHAEQKLILRDDCVIDFDDFSQLLDGLTARDTDLPSPPCGLVFLNGCESAIGEKDLKLRWHTARQDICGVIATESIVRRKYAVRFGYRFLKLMINKGRTIGDTMDLLHHSSSLWPESLIYGCYAHPDYCIESPVGANGGLQAPALQAE